MWLLVSIDWLLLSQDSEGEHFKKIEISFLQCFGAKGGTPPCDGRLRSDSALLQS